MGMELPQRVLFSFRKNLKLGFFINLISKIENPPNEKLYKLQKKEEVFSL